MKKKLFLVLIIFSVFLGMLYSADWVVASCEFEVEDSAVISESEKSSLKTLATQIPSLMLDYLPLGVYRTVYPDEILERDLYEIRKNKQSQYETLHNAIITRDSLMFSYSGFNLNKKIRDAENAIKTAQEKIVSYEESEKKTKESFEQNKKKTNSSELISIYKNDSSKLFTLKNGSVSQKEINSSSVRSLITGKIYYNHGFLQVETTLTIYPKNEVIATATEIGTIEESEYIALSMMNVLLETMINDELVSADILIYPKEAGDNSTIFIEDSVYHGSAVTATFTSGTHTIRVESPGYDTTYFDMDYESGQDKIITINMNEKTDTQVLFEQKNAESVTLVDEQQIPPKGPEIFLNTFSYGTLPLVANISESAMLGESISPEGNSAYFLLKRSDDIKKSKNTDEDVTENSDKNKNAKVSVPVAKQNLEKKIDLTRKIMYWSYGGLILTVPVYYYFSGMSNLMDVNTAVLGYESTSIFSTGKMISMYVLIGAGVNFLTQLVIYLVSANKVIPTVVYSQPTDASDEKRMEEVKIEQEVREAYYKSLSSENADDENEVSGENSDSAGDENGVDDENGAGGNGNENGESFESDMTEEEALKQMQEMQKLINSIER